MSEPASIQVVCDRCCRTYLAAEAAQIDGERVGVCPTCAGHLESVPEPLHGELERLFRIEAAAREWHRAHQAEIAAQVGSPYRRDRLLPPGEPGVALVRLAELLADA